MTPSAATLAALAERLNGPGAAALAGLSDAEILAAWEGAVDAFLDPASPERREIQAGLVRNTRLSPEGLEAGLEAVLGGMRGEPAARLFAEAAELRREGRSAAELRREEHSVRQGRTLRASSHASVVLGSNAVPGVGCGPATPRSNLALIVLSSNLPALAVQPLLPALAARRPALLKSPSAEPLFAPAFVRALVRRLPALEPAVAALTWPGGDEVLEAPLLARAGVVLAYGDDETVADLERRTAEAGGAHFVAYGPKTSLAVIGRDAAAARTGAAGAGGRARALALEAEAGTARDAVAGTARNAVAGTARNAVAGIARDVVLFDQRGCLSIAAVYLEGDEAAARGLADAFAAELGRLARELPPGPADPAAAAAVQQLRAEADLRGLYRPRLGAGTGGEPPLAAGTVIVGPEPTFQPTPGLRTVRVHLLPELGRLPEVLAPWRGRLQGVALTGVPDAAAAGRLAAALAALGVSRIAPPGELQRPDALWHNGGVSPLAALIGA